MSMILCDWCGQPALEGHELCEKCLEAQARVEAGQLIPDEPCRPAKRHLPVLAATGAILLLIVKGVAVLALGAAMLAAGLFGACSAIVATLMLVSNPMGAASLWALAALAVGFTFLMYWLMARMFASPPRQIERKDYPSIEKKD